MTTSTPLLLALQGGGAHGAFTWGVLDRLLEEPIEIEAVSGTSAGAMNAVALAHGLMQDGREGARASLRQLWENVADNATNDPTGIADTITEIYQAANGGSSPWVNALLGVSQYVSPEKINPLDLNPLGDMLEELFDFKRLRRDCPVQLHIAATRVDTGRPAVFRETELTVNHLLASACLPTVFHTVEVDGVAYWDGGFAINPPVATLLENADARDLLMVLLNPLGRDEVPTDADDIQHRVKELTFGAGFLRELAAIARQRVKSEHQGYAQDDEQRRLRDTHFHMIAAEDSVKGLDSRSRYNAHGELLADLHKEGRRHAEDWLETCGSGFGKHSTVDLAARFL